MRNLGGILALANQDASETCPIQTEMWKSAVKFVHAVIYPQRSGESRSETPIADEVPLCKEHTYGDRSPFKGGNPDVIETDPFDRLSRDREDGPRRHECLRSNNIRGPANAIGSTPSLYIGAKSAESVQGFAG
jgi:hypothetical protein